MRSFIFYATICISLAVYVNAASTVTKYKTVTTTLYRHDADETTTSKEAKATATEPPVPNHSITSSASPAFNNGGPMDVESSGSSSAAAPAETEIALSSQSAAPAAKDTTSVGASASLPAKIGTTSAAALGSGTTARASASGKMASSGNGFTFSPITLAPESSRSGTQTSVHAFTAKVSGNNAADQSAGVASYAVSFATIAAVTIFGVLANTAVQL